MPREKPSYRDVLDRLDEVFPNKHCLIKRDIAEYMGLALSTVYKMNIPSSKGKCITKEDFARWVVLREEDFRVRRIS